MKKISMLLALLCSHSLINQTSGEDWFQFRGPNASGLSEATQIPQTWDAKMNIKWKVDVPGDGWSCPVVADGKVFLTTAITNGEQSQDSDYRWEVVCLDAKTGENVWSKVALEGKPRLKTHRDNTYASETPVTDGKYVVAYFGMMGVFCYDMDGSLMWSKDLGLYSMRNDWGTSSSPAMLDGKVFLQIDNEQASFIVALNAETGEELWRKPREESSNWGSVVVWKNDKRTEIVTGGSIVRSYNPNDGELLWQVDIGGGGLSTTASATDSMLVVGRGGRGGTSIFAVKSGASGNLSASTEGEPNNSVIWNTAEYGPERSSPLIYNGYVYLLGGRGGKITCLDASTGALVFQDRLPNAAEFWASPWANNGLVYCPDSSGKTFVVKPGPQLEVVGTNTLPADSDAKFWASPAISDGSIYLRSDDVLYSISKTE